MKKKVILSSILTIALCISLIAGSAFALFTSTSQVNVAVTSGKVSVVATASGLELGSTLGENLPETLAAADGNTITLDKMVPGDFITFTITIHNDSDVTVKYRTLFAMTSGDESFFNALKITVDQQAAEEVSPLSLDDTVSAVATPAGTMLPDCADIVLKVKVELPESAGNEHQEKSCAFAYTVEAVQGNAETSDELVYYVTDVETFRAAAANGGKAVLVNDITFTADDLVFAFHSETGNEDLNAMVVFDKNLTLDLNGYEVTNDVVKELFICFYVTNGATLNIYDTSDAETGTVFGTDPLGTYAVFVNNEATANIYGGNFKNKDGSVIYKNDGYINIYGGTFENEKTFDSLMNLGNPHTSHGPIVISGGSFKNFEPGVTNGSETEVASGYKVVKDGDWYNVVAE